MSIEILGKEIDDTDDNALQEQAIQRLVSLFPAEPFSSLLNARMKAVGADGASSFFMTIWLVFVVDVLQVYHFYLEVWRLLSDKLGGRLATLLSIVFALVTCPVALVYLVCNFLYSLVLLVHSQFAGGQKSFIKWELRQAAYCHVCHWVVGLKQLAQLEHTVTWMLDDDLWPPSDPDSRLGMLRQRLALEDAAKVVRSFADEIKKQVDSSPKTGLMAGFLVMPKTNDSPELRIKRDAGGGYYLNWWRWAEGRP